MLAQFVGEVGLSYSFVLSDPTELVDELDVLIVVDGARTANIGLECLTKPRYASLEWILAMPSGAPPIGAFAFPEASSK
jgi:hypothetical protein